ncbi:MAG: hypothetical protein H6852_18475 [Geminicoccaceae bacterium]|jgi:hypothetical protein|nr:hypothetical protein [Geminicoccaceae bacterium]MCB9969605.1 hypothetical protein [Geminicoccaceae bacterium]
MTSKQIHELLPVATLTAEDRIVVSTASGNLTRHATIASIAARMPGAGAVDRRISDKLSEAVSVRDFGAVGDGVANDAPAFEAALGAHLAVHVPAGRYRLASTVMVKPGRTITGDGRQATVLVAEGPLALAFQRNAGAYAIDSSSADDWCRSSLRGLTIRMSAGGIQAIGHEFRIDDVNFFGGAAAGWCIDMVDANECVVNRINAGYGGGTRHQMNANGVRWRALKAGVNYGDSLVSEVSIKLGATNTTGVLIDGHSADPARLINNMTLKRIQVNAPTGGGGSESLSGTVGIKLWNAARIVQIDCDVEVVATAFEEYSESVGGASGACVANTYIGCIAHYCQTNYRDSNALFSRSVIQRSFIGCDNVAPLRTGSAAGDGGRCQDGDAFLTGAWLFNRSSEPSIQLRSHDKDVLLVTGDHKGTSQADADGHVSQSRPYRGLLVELSSKQSAKITRPVSLGATDPDNAAASLQDVRLELGNGQGDSRGELARVQINDPLYLSPRTAQPQRPINGLMHYATDAGALPATGERYLGPGIYCQLNDGEYSPVAVQRGALPQREVNNDWFVSANDFGKVLRVNNGSSRTLTIPAGLVPNGVGARRFWVIRQGTGNVFFAGGTGVSLRTINGRNWIARQFQMTEVVLFPDNQVYLHHLAPDVEDTFVHPVHWTSGLADGMSSSHMGKLVRVSSGAASTPVMIPTGLVPLGQQAATVKLVKVAAADVVVTAGPGMTLVAPGGGSTYTITEIGRVVELTVTAADLAQQPNHIYIQA